MAEKGARSTSRARDGASVNRAVDNIHGDDVPREDRFLYILCAECGAQVDKVEYSIVEGPNPHVAQLQSLLGCDEKTAGQILSKENPDLLRSQEERARELADKIVGKSVEDRPADTYACPNGHDAGLEVAE
jgi:hypothetical protein